MYYTSNYFLYENSFNDIGLGNEESNNIKISST